MSAIAVFVDEFLGVSASVCFPLAHVDSNQAIAFGKHKERLRRAHALRVRNFSSIVLDSNPLGNSIYVSHH